MRTIVETMRVIYGGRTPEQHWMKYRTQNLLNSPNLTKDDLNAVCEEMAAEMELDKKSENRGVLGNASKYLGAIKHHKAWTNLLEGLTQPPGAIFWKHPLNCSMQKAQPSSSLPIT